MSRLFHFTCDHGAEGIRRLGYVGPNHHPLLRMQVAWFTDLPEPDADAVGLTSTTLDCNRLTHRFEVDASIPHPWLGSVEQASTPVHLQADLHRFSAPKHWWISQVKVPILSYS